MAGIEKDLLLLFDRPNEPLITPKGDEKAIFQLTDQFLSKDYESNGLDYNTRFGEDASRRIPLINLDQLPQFTKAKELPNDADFSLFLPKHQEMANEVIGVLMGVPENQLQNFLSTCVFARVNLNPQLFNYCYSVALMHRNDTKNVPIPNFAETFPAKFLDSKTFAQARETTAVLPESAQRTPIFIPRNFTATDLEEEHRLAYFREDIGVNLHHWHWHLVYPFTASDISIVNKNRRGELFFFMHQQIIARYNGERLCNLLKRAQKWNNWRDTITDAYYSKLDSLTSSRGWPPRQGNMVWQDLDRPVDGLLITLDDMERWRRNIEEAISTGLVKLPNGTTRPLDIDTLGNILEASDLSPNPNYYGSVHNNGHTFTAYMHDPKHRFLEQFNVMGDEATTMRDPFFYRWHSYVDDVFQRFKESRFVRPYTQSELENPGVQITSISIESDTGSKNTLNTFWMQSDVNLSRGLDFSNRGPVLARFTHLNHRPFRYIINVNNSGNARSATVRIFAAPKKNEGGQQWVFADHRKMFIELDKFVTPLNAGNNTITRLSTQSTVTIPFEQTFRDLSAQGKDPRRPDLAAFNFCGCGWPQHMLVPKGSAGGEQYQLFVMLSNYELDKLDQPTTASTTNCVEAFSFCGLKDKLYPDKRAMGYPFDRPSNIASDIESFLTPNMALQDIIIKFQDVTEQNPRNPRP